MPPIVWLAAAAVAVVLMDMAMLDEAIDMSISVCVCV